MFKKKKT